MKIESIKFNNKSYVPAKKENRDVLNFSERKYQDYSSIQPCYLPAFTAASANILPMGLNFKRAKNIRCLYCGKEMISPKVFSGLFDFEFDSSDRTSASFLAYAKSNFDKLSDNAKKIVQKFEKDYKAYPKDSLKEHLKAIRYQKDPMIESMLIQKKTFTGRAIDVINGYKDILPPVQARAFAKVEAAYNASPNKRLTDIMADLRPKYLQILANRQNSIIEKMELLSDIFSLEPQYRKQFIEGSFNEDFAERIESIPSKISSEFKHNIKEILENAKARTDIRSEDPFKRKAFIEDIDRLNVSEKEAQMLELMREVAVSMPSSTTSLSAFMVKYSGMTSKITAQAATRRIEDGFSAQERELLGRFNKQYEKIVKNIGTEQLIQAIYPENLTKLQNSRATLVELIRSRISSMNSEFNQKMLEFSDEMKNSIAINGQSPTKVKEDMNSKVDGFRGNIHSEIIDSIRKRVLSLPTPTNDTDAFVVTFKDKLPLKSEIQKFEATLSNKNREIFNQVKLKYLGQEEDSLRQNVAKNYTGILGSLNAKQSAIATNIDDFYKTAFESFVKKTDEILKDLNNSFEKQSADFVSQQKVLNRFKELKIPVVSYMNSFHSYAERLATSENNMSAFVVKYHNTLLKNQTRTGYVRPRTDKEVAEAFLSQLIETEEHIKPRVNWAKNDPEKNRADNLGLAHKGCNENRSCGKLADAVRQKPIIATYYQYYLNDVVKNIKNGFIDKSYLSYPENFSKRVYEESEGLIKLRYRNFKQN